MAERLGDGLLVVAAAVECYLETFPYRALALIQLLWVVGVLRIQELLELLEPEVLLLRLE